MADPDSSRHRDAEVQVSEAMATLKPALLAYLGRACRHEADAEEIAQVVFLRLYQVLLSGAVIVDVRHWVFHVARNLVIDRSKRLKVRAPRECELSEAIVDVVPDAQETPEALLLVKARTKCIRAVVAALPRIQRRCLTLRAEGLMLREIGDRLGMDVRRVDEAIDRAVTNLRRAFGVPVRQHRRRER